VAISQIILWQLVTRAEPCAVVATQADHFELCYLLIEGCFYVDADDVCVCTDINWLFEDGRLKLQPL
jgi:hypothetical protein